MTSVLKNTWAVLEPKERKRFSILVTLDIMISITDILSLALLLSIIKFYIEPSNDGGYTFLPAWMVLKKSIWLIALFFILFSLKNIFAWLISRAWYKFVSSIAVRLSRINLINYQRAGFEDFINTDSSVHIRKIAFQPFEFCQNVLASIPQIITQVSLILLTIIAIILFDAKLFLLLLVMLLPPVIVIFYFIRKRLTRTRAEVKISNERSFQCMLDALKGYVESNVYDRNDFFLNRFISSRKRFSDSYFDSVNIQTMPPRVIEIFAVLGLFILIAIAKWSGNNDTDYVVTIGAFIAAAYKIIPGVVKVINLSGQIRAYDFSINDFRSVKQQTENKEKKVNELSYVQLKEISFQFDQKKLLENFTLGIEKGDFIVITGDSGKGKTTIVNLLLGFISPAKGNILFNNMPLKQEDICNYWPLISYVKQQSFLIHDSLLRNVTLEEGNHSKERLNTAIEISGLKKFIGTAPEGLEKMITENGSNISGGQRQRIAIARAVYKNADLVILDEPFNELDEASECELLKSFKKLAEGGKMIVLITHNKNSLSFATKTVTLDEDK